MDEESTLESALNEYKSQLSSVETALTFEDKNQDLLLLQDNLQEVIQLTEESLLNIKKEKLLASLSCLETTATPSSSNNSLPNSRSKTKDSEFDLFKSEITKVEDAFSDQKEIQEVIEADESLSCALIELEGKKCRAPHKKEWGELTYHNALILNIATTEIVSVEDLEVKVLFCNPTSQSMKPCAFYLKGHCKFSNEECKFSHGYKVKVSELQEFKEPDYSLLERDALCLAKYKDDIWYAAIVEKDLGEHKFEVKYKSYNETAQLNLEDILPMERVEDSSSETSNEFDSDEELFDSSINALMIFKDCSSMMHGEWEKYTRGIGSKLMEKMGYIRGQGLGKNSEGRIDPVEAVYVPKGKSLDKCMELRELEFLKDGDKERRKAMRKKRIAERKIAAGYKQKYSEPKNNVFDFINSAVFKKVKNMKENLPQKPFEDVKKSTNQGLNVQMLKLNEEGKKASRELFRLKQALARNKDKDRKMQSQLEDRIKNQENFIRSLQHQETVVGREQKMRDNHKKMTVF